MTDFFGGFLYLLAVVIAFWFWTRVRGRSFAEVLARMAEEHHRVSAVWAKHPHGGRWPEYRRWEELAATGTDASAGG